MAGISLEVTGIVIININVQSNYNIYFMYLKYPSCKIFTKSHLKSFYHEGISGEGKCI